MYSIKNVSRRLVLVIAITCGVMCWVARAEAQSGAGFANSVCAGKVIPINQIPNQMVLYKPENIHGGRGPSFLVQNTAQQTGKQVIEIRNARCEVIGAFGLFATDQPFGARYYSRTGGSGHSDAQLLEAARLAGSTNILVEGVNGTWILVKDPTLRDGSVRK